MFMKFSNIESTSGAVSYLVVRDKACSQSYRPKKKTLRPPTVKVGKVV